MKTIDRKKLNYQDFIAMGGAILLIISLLIFTLVKFPSRNGSKVEIFYDNDKIFTYDIKETRTIKLEKKDYPKLVADMEIVIKDGGVLVEKEDSPRHICSKQGLVKEANRPIVCLPNSVYIVIVSSDGPDFDGGV